jgi:hypothetical protein
MPVKAKRTPWFARILILILLMGMLASLCIVPLSVQAKPPTPFTSPPLSDFINIWANDSVDNLNPAVAYNSVHDEYLVVWENDRGALRDIYAQRVKGDGTLKSWFSVVSYANKWSYLPDVAYSPVQDEYFIVYTYQYSASDYTRIF